MEKRRFWEHIPGQEKVDRRPRVHSKKGMEEGWVEELRQQEKYILTQLEAWER